MTDKQAGELLRDMVDEFPGLIDGETDVNGGDLVQWLTEELIDYKTA